ncbi:MAG: hypothetical protein NZP74_14420 [Anaerolineales bacterium]|nr:hypothetical protein [Anaerolineales bacterium]MDW8278904.1 hypothetical protein [Anaerolineales bacterium]
MSLLSILEIFISLIFAWLVLSIAVMYIQEWVGARLRLRAVMLEKHIRNFLADPALAEQFYEHPLIQSLHTGDDQANLRRPSYIPAQIFSLALFDILLNAGKPSSILQYEIQKLRPTIERLKKDERARAEAQFRLVLMAARKAVNTRTGEIALENAMSNVRMELEHLGRIHPALQDTVDEVFRRVEVTAQDVDVILAGIEAERQQAGSLELTPFEQIRDGIAALGATNPQLQQALESLMLGIEKSDQALGAARQRVEAWFDNGVERLSGWYKRQAQKMSFVIGIAVAVVLNADTLALTQTLWREPLVRQTLNAQAQALIQQNQDGLRPMSAEELAALQLQFNTLNVPIGWVGAPLPADSDGGVLMLDGSYKKCTLWPRSSIDYYGLKIGRLCYPVINAPAPNDPTGILLKLFGLFASGIAAAQGAPFWFDILKKAINIRTSGANPSEPKG